MQVMTVALEDRMLGYRQEDVEIAGRAAIDAGRTFIRQADTRAFLNPGRHIDIQRPFLLHQARAAAGLAGMTDDLAIAAARRAGTLDGEEALGGTHPSLAVAGAGGAGLRTMAGLSARAGADIAGNLGRHPDLGSAAGIGFLQGNFE